MKRLNLTLHTWIVYELQLYTIVTLVYDARAQEFIKVIKSCIFIDVRLFYNVCPIFDTLPWAFLSGIVYFFFYSAYLSNASTIRCLSSCEQNILKKHAVIIILDIKYFAFLFCTRIIVSVDNFFTRNRSAREDIHGWSSHVCVREEIKPWK